MPSVPAELASCIAGTGYVAIRLVALSASAIGRLHSLSGSGAGQEHSVSARPDIGIQGLVASASVCSLSQWAPRWFWVRPGCCEALPYFARPSPAEWGNNEWPTNAYGLIFKVLAIRSSDCGLSHSLAP